MAGHRVCPWWQAYSFDNRFRRFFHDPRKLFAPYVKPGTRALDLGCGLGWASIEMARLVGPSGKVVSLDLQPQMIRALEKRARRAGVSDRIETVCASINDLTVDQPADFALAFWTVHEFPDTENAILRIRASLRAGGHFFAAEPSGHVGDKDFARFLEISESNRFHLEKRPKVAFSKAAVLTAA